MGLLQIPVQGAWHTPLTQEVVHTLPQPPQLFRSVLVLISHPLAALPSQLAKPALQAMLHAPAKQEGVPLVLEHAAPQPPQLAVSAASDFSQPLPVLPSQLPYK